MSASHWKLPAAVLCVAAVGAWGFAEPPPGPPRPPGPLGPGGAPGAEPPPLRPGRPPVAPFPGAKPVVNADVKQRLRSANNLKQILIGFHDYHDKHRHLPHDIAGKDGKALLSWRVAILPFIGEEKLYKQFKLDEPWDSESNKKLLAKMPDVYRIVPEAKGATRTYYQGFSGPGALFGPGKSVNLVFGLRGGSANTLAVVEAGPPVEWTKPADLPYDAAKPLPKLELPFANVLMAATADGDARPFRPDLDGLALRQLIEGEGPRIPEALRPPLFPLTKDDEAFGRMLLAENDKLIRAIGAQLAEHRKLLDELAKRVSPDNPAGGFDLTYVSETNKELKRKFEEFKRQADLLRREVEAAGKE